MAVEIDLPLAQPVSERRSTFLTLRDRLRIAEKQAEAMDGRLLQTRWTTSLDGTPANFEKSA